MFRNFFAGQAKFFLGTGNNIDILKQIPNNSIDCIITSPPYWQQRIYEDYDGEFSDIIGSEESPDLYVDNLLKVIDELFRILKNSGTFWLNIGDKFYNKCLMGMPWRVALAMQNKGWILRSDIIWDQMKGTQSCKDRFRDIYEHVFQFVKSKNYYFDGDNVKIIPQKDASFSNGVCISATGVSGKKYFEKINNSTFLSEEEKNNALKALNDTIEEMKNGIIVDFRMTIRGEQRTYHSENSRISGRAQELATKGYFILKMRKSGYLPSNIWRIVPEDKWRKDTHCAVFPEELLRIPILSSCPPNGIVLDPFSGTGSTVHAAIRLGRRGIGIDLSKQYTDIAMKRVCDDTPLLSYCANNY